MSQDTHHTLSLAGKSALITGASGGIGGAVADSLARANARLLLSGRNAKRLHEAAERAQRLGAAEVYTHPSDLADAGAVPSLVDVLRETLGGVDLLVHSIGVFRGSGRPFEDASLDDFDLMYRVNVRVPYQLTQLCLPGLRKRHGQVVFVNSTSGQTSHPTVSAYCASKFALRAVADSLRAEVNEAGVRVLTCYPGRTASDMQAEVREFENKPYDPADYMQPADVAHSIVAALTLPRSAELTELTVRQMTPPS